MTHGFPTVEEAIAIHDSLIKEFGGVLAILDAGALTSAILRPQIGYYDNLIQEAATLMENLANNHPFVDGNKRVCRGCYRRIPTLEWALHRLRRQ